MYADLSDFVGVLAMIAKSAQPDMSRPVSQSRHVGEIIHRLDGWQLLLFGVALLVVGGGSAVGLAGLLLKQPELYWGVLAVLLGIVCATVILIWSERARPANENLVNDTAIDEELSAIRRNVEAAIRRAHPRFRAGMIKSLQIFGEQVSHWAVGEFRDEAGSFNAHLVKLYESTKNPVFSVISPHALTIWGSTISARVEKAIKAHHVVVTRVFFFPTKEHVTAAHKELIRDQMRYCKEVRIYINQDDHTSEDAANARNSDFHFFDHGDAIVLIDEANNSTFSGVFWFNEANRKKRYSQLMATFYEESNPPAVVFPEDFPGPASSNTSGSQGGRRPSPGIGAEETTTRDTERGDALTEVLGNPNEGKSGEITELKPNRASQPSGTDHH